MPFAKLPEVTLYYTVDGPVHAPPLVFSNSLGCDAGMWTEQAALLARDFRVVRYDTRGHGLSEVMASSYGFAELAGDVVGLLDHLDIESADFCGISMGGLTGIALAVDHPGRVNRLVLSNTAARIGSVEGWSARIEAVRTQGLWQMAPTLVERWLSDSFRAAHPGATQVLVDMLRRTPEAGYLANCAVLRDEDWTARAASITRPTMVIAGTQDAATTVAQGQALQKAIAGAGFIELPTSHIANHESPQRFLELLQNFLSHHEINH